MKTFIITLVMCIVSFSAHAETYPGTQEGLSWPANAIDPYTNATPDMCNEELIAAKECWLVAGWGGTPGNPEWVVWWTGGGTSCPGGYWGYVHMPTGYVYSDFTPYGEKLLCHNENTFVEFSGRGRFNDMTIYSETGRPLAGLHLRR